MAEPTALLEVRSLATELSTDRGALRAVDDVSLVVEEGRTVGVVGESGSGKSMLVRSIMGIAPPTATITGSVHFEGTDLLSIPPRARRQLWGGKIAMVFQNPMTSLNPVRTIGRQIADPLRVHLGLSRSAARDRATELLTDVGIPEPARRLAQYPHHLSGGMRQRVCIAIALACEPRLLIADEPTTALDVTVQKQILDLLARLQREREMSMLLISHDLGVVAGRTDRVMVMYAGRVVEQASTVTLFERNEHPYTEALFRSRPRLDSPSGTPFEAIAGRSPDMVHPPAGCRFAPRCQHVLPMCSHTAPPVAVQADEDHTVECHLPVMRAS
jgi:peptide/nickel transport system ATP-binding protein